MPLQSLSSLLQDQHAQIKSASSALILDIFHIFVADMIQLVFQRALKRGRKLVPLIHLLTKPLDTPRPAQPSASPVLNQL